MVSYSLSSSLPAPVGEVCSQLGMPSRLLPPSLPSALALGGLWPALPGVPSPGACGRAATSGSRLCPPGWELTAQAATPLSFPNQIIPMFMPR